MAANDTNRLIALVTEGLDGASAVADDSGGIEVTTQRVPDLLGFLLKCTRLGMSDVRLVARDGGLAILLRRPSAPIAVVPEDAGPERLSNREHQVAGMLARGLSNKEIAEHLMISVKTVDTHRGHALKKLGLRNNCELTRFAVRHGMVQA